VADVDLLLERLVGIHAETSYAEQVAEAKRTERDQLVARAIGAGVTPYRLAKLLGVSGTSPARMARAAAKRATG